MSARAFHLGDLLSVTTGALVSPRHIEGVQDLLGFMVGDEQLMPHALPRAGEACAPALLEQHPDLAAIETPTFSGFGDNGSAKAAVEAWLAVQVELYGETREVVPLAEYAHLDPITELVMRREKPPTSGTVHAPAGNCGPCSAVEGRVILCRQTVVTVEQAEPIALPAGPTGRGQGVYPLPLIRRPLQQHERELAIMATLDVTADTWASWVKATGDEHIPVEVHTTIVGVLQGLRAEDAGEYQHYLQALTMASDSTVLWLLEQLGQSPFPPGGPA